MRKLSQSLNGPEAGGVSIFSYDSVEMLMLNKDVDLVVAFIEDGGITLLIEDTATDSYLFTEIV
jgi:hypothetical protein